MAESFDFRGSFLEHMYLFRWVRKSGQFGACYLVIVCVSLSNPIWKTCLKSSINVSESSLSDLLSG